MMLKIFFLSEKKLLNAILAYNIISYTFKTVRILLIV